MAEDNIYRFSEGDGGCVEAFSLRHFWRVDLSQKGISKSAWENEVVIQ